MTHPNLPIEGACMCGQVKMRDSAPPIMTTACHCKSCQKLSASAFSLSAMIPIDGFEITSGQTQIGALHGDNPYHYCPNCLNWFYTGLADAPFVNVRPTMFDATAWSTPFIESYVTERLPWVRTAAKHSFAQLPGMEDDAPLMAEYAAESAGSSARCPTFRALPGPCYAFRNRNGREFRHACT